MGCRILVGEEYAGAEAAVFFCSTTGIAFGPVMREIGDLDCQEVAHAFIKWLEGHKVSRKYSTGERMTSDPRVYPVPELMDLYSRFHKEMEAKNETLANCD